MRRLEVIEQRSGKTIGSIQLRGDTVQLDGTAAHDVFHSLQRAGEWSDLETFDKLATGWSNGYVTIPASA